ncbi:transcriptional regulator [Pantoea sp.]|uniref:winged helix-turn-helix domain-containing protein n=1 Tax=Pantoea sp. TaxID=69393 RepID=UPI0031D880AA
MMGNKVTMTSDCIINHWLLDISSASLIHQQTGEQRRLGEYQLKLLVVLIQHAGQILSREALNQLVWERRVIGSNSLPNAIHALRVALEDDGKQQRIIKTVPKKGYILETEFCQFQRRANDEEEEETDSQLLSFTPPTLPTIAPVEKNEEIDPISAATVSTSSAKAIPSDAIRQRWIKLFFLTLLIFLALLALVLRSALQEKPRFIAMPVESVNQIRLLQLTHTLRDPGTNQQSLPKELENTLRELDKALQQRAMKMDIYYSASGTSLNLTLNLQSACGHQQLAMAIFNAGDQPEALSKLIKSETERKMNEMVPCLP